MRHRNKLRAIGDFCGQYESWMVGKQGIKPCYKLYQSHVPTFLVDAGAQIVSFRCSCGTADDRSNSSSDLREVYAAFSARLHV